MQSTLEVVLKYGMMLTCGSFGHFLSNSQASLDEKHCDFFLTEKALSEIPEANLHFKCSGNCALSRIDSHVIHLQSNSDIID
jgi:hypothetical protein